MKKLDVNTIFLVIGALVVAFGAYWFFFTGNGNQPALTSDSGGNEAQAQFEALIAQLAPITFDTAIFSDARFKALVDLSTPIAPEPAGRIDPFAPIPGVTGR